MLRNLLIPILLAAPVAAQWSMPTPVTNPGEKSNPSMVYDLGNSETVLFGGQGSAGLSNETWTYDGTNWTLETPATSPPARREAAMAYDITRGVTVLFGGRGASTELSDTWEWNGSNWTQVSTTGPSRRQGHSMAYDAGRGVTVLFGGSRNPDFCFPVLTDTWEWNGTTWTQASPTGSPPASTVYGGMVYDLLHAKIVYYGGTDCGVTDTGTYEYDGASWTNVAGSVGPGPSYFTGIGLARFGMVYDVAHSITILYGGRNEGVGGYATGTWKYDGTSWAEVDSGTPSTRTSFGMAMDDGRGVAVVYGGTNVAGATAYFHETWEYGCPPATFARFGTGCGGSGGPPPLLNSFDLPRVGSSFTLTYQGPNAVTPVSDDHPYFMIGFVPQNIAVPMITPTQPTNCTLYLDPAVTFASPLRASGTSYESDFVLNIPQDIGLVGFEFYGQVATIFMRTSGAPNTFIRFTNRADMVVGV